MRNFFFTVILIPLLAVKPLHAGVAKDVDVKRVQTSLTKLCLNPGPIDGLWGRKTENAAKQFLKDQKKTFSGTFTKDDENTLWGVLNSREIQASFGTGSVTLCEVNQSGEVASKKNKPSKEKKIHFFDNGCCEIPDSIAWQPNDATLEYYYKKTANLRHQMLKINGARNPRQFTKKIEKHPFIEREMATKTILSYLYYDDGMIVYDALPPSDRFGIKFDNVSYFPSHSMGKSITSYLVGHAICQGYISSVDEPIDDWPLMKNTLYYGQPLIKLLNMQAGDTHVIKKYSGKFTKTGRSIHGNAPLLVAVQNPQELKNTKPKAGAKYAYSNLTADVIFNYLMHRVGNDFDKFIHDFYQNKVGIEHPVYLWMNPLFRRTSASRFKDLTNQGAGQYGVSATRYDFLRIAVAILEDWQSNTCEGKYLRQLNKRSVSKGNKRERWDGSDRRYGNAEFGRLTRRYSGQFHSQVVGLEKRDVFVMNGANGQQIAIDFENSRIVAIAAVKSHDYDTRRLGYQPIKFGRIR